MASMLLNDNKTTTKGRLHAIYVQADHLRVYPLLVSNSCRNGNDWARRGDAIELPDSSFEASKEPHLPHQSESSTSKAKVSHGN